MRTLIALLLTIVLLAPVSLRAESPPPATNQKKVLLLGIDGCRYDALQFSQAKHLKKLVEEGAHSELTDVLGDRKTGATTITGPGWCTVLCGVLADKHGVKDNSFRDARLTEYPTFFQRISEVRPGTSLIALVSWKPFQEHVFAGLPGCRLIADGDTVGYGEGDRQVTAAAVEVLHNENPTALFVYFGEVDITGHGYGFHPRAPKYTNAIETVDEQVGRILEAVRQRQTFAAEDWLTIVCTDHGGEGREHGLGENVPNIRTVFIILHGDSVEPGQIERPTCNTDVAVTALTHLGIPLRKEWKLDGSAVGLRSGDGKEAR